MNTISKTYMLLLSALSVILCSCRTHFPEPEFADFATTPDISSILSNFKKGLPEKLSMDQSALIQIGRKKITAIGICRFDTKKDETALALITTTGMKLLEITSNGKNTTTFFAIPEVKDPKGAAEELIRDIKTIYFQPLTQENRCEVSRDKVTYTWIDSDQKTELLFGHLHDTSKIMLLTKKVYEKDSLASVVYYSHYKMEKGKNIPMTIHYENRKFDYSLILKTKKIYYDK